MITEQTETLQEQSIGNLSKKKNTTRCIQKTDAGSMKKTHTHAVRGLTFVESGKCPKCEINVMHGTSHSPPPPPLKL